MRLTHFNTTFKPDGNVVAPQTVAQIPVLGEEALVAVPTSTKHGPTSVILIIDNHNFPGSPFWLGWARFHFWLWPPRSLELNRQTVINAVLDECRLILLVL